MLSATNYSFMIQYSDWYVMIIWLEQSFWPSIVMRKWLNIKPKVHEFSEDEIDTESDDDGMI